jgi:methylmalonyl-CoA mutase cobalamin-binding subunit
MSVRDLIESKGTFVSVIPSHMTVDNAINQLEADDVSAIVVSLKTPCRSSH